MSIYKRMRRACCFDCGRSGRDCSCMSGRVRGNVDTLERAFPLSSVSVSDCSTTFRACKFNPYAQSSMPVLSVASSPSRVVPHVLCLPPTACGDVSPLLPVSLCVCWGGFPPCSVNLTFLIRACRLWHYNPVTLFLSPLKKLIWQHIKCWIDTEMHGNVYLPLWGKASDIGLGWKEVGKRCRENKPTLA